MTDMLDLPNNETEYQTFIKEFWPDPKINTAISQLYPWQEFEKSGDALSRMVADVSFHCPTIVTANQWSQQRPTFMYEFTQATSSLVFDLIQLRWHKNAAEAGTMHGEELPYIFGYDTIVGSAKSDEQQQARQNMMTYWGNFARTGNPNGETVPQWPDYTIDSPRYVQIAADVTTTRDQRTHYCKLWDQIH